MLLSPENLREIFKQAIEEYPEECCGIVIGFPNDVESNIIYRCSNIQNELHLKDPEKYPRTAKTAYFIDPQDLLKIHREARERGMQIKINYHSHIDEGAYFSQEDRERALISKGEPAHPGVAYLVVSVFNRQIEEISCYQWDEEREDFVLKPLKLG